jgi:P pilus assembly chaperone PapD
MQITFDPTSPADTLLIIKALLKFADRKETFLRVTKSEIPRNKTIRHGLQASEETNQMLLRLFVCLLVRPEIEGTESRRKEAKRVRRAL